MKKLYFLLLLSFFIQKANAQWVTIPDANFVTFLQQQYPQCMNGNQMDTTCIWIVMSPSIDCSNKNISDLTGIQYFDNLQILSCHQNQLITLPTLPNTLLNLGCFNNQITILPNLPNGLQSLGCWGNSLVSLPPLPDSLEILNTMHNQLTSLPQLPNKLEILSCYHNQLISLPQLP